MIWVYYEQFIRIFREKEKYIRQNKYNLELKQLLKFNIDACRLPLLEVW